MPNFKSLGVSTMDPVTQGLLGAIVPQSFAKKESAKVATIVGALSGMAPDLDVLIRSKNDPLLFIEFHRHFTHSLFFVPFGALLCTLVFYFIYKKQQSFSLLYFYSFLGFATHGLLDTCTSYGTRLLWPFSDARLSWSIISIVDPIFTIVLLIAVIGVYEKKRKSIARLGLGFVTAYFILGTIQHNRALDYQLALANSRNHQISRGIVKPGFGNIILWRSIYEANGNYYVDAMRLPYFGKVQLSEGESIKKLVISRDLSNIPKESITFKDIKRFELFSQGFISFSKDDPNLITDVRYGLTTNGVSPLWAISIDPSQTDQHTPFITFRQKLMPSMRGLWAMIIGG
jgi:inner membrane protein